MRKANPVINIFLLLTVCAIIYVGCSSGGGAEDGGEAEQAAAPAFFKIRSGP